MLVVAISFRPLDDKIFKGKTWPERGDVLHLMTVPQRQKRCTVAKYKKLRGIEL